MHDLGRVRRAPHALERLDPLERVDEVPVEELRRLLHGRALAAVLVAPVRLALGRAREVEVEVRRQPRRPGRAREHDAKDVGVLVLVDERAEVEELGRRLRREPLSDVPARSRASTLPTRPSTSRTSVSSWNEVVPAPSSPA